MSSDLTIGERLKKARMDRGFSLEDLQKKTKIHINILKAIEGEALTNLNPVYLKGFIKIYCMELGLDYRDYMSGYKENVVPVTVTSKKSTNSFLKSAGLRLTSLSLSKRLRKAVITAVTAAIFTILLFKVSGCLFGRKKDIPLNHANQPLAAQPAQTQNQALPKEALGGIRLVVSARDKCLVFVKADGKIVFHRVLEKGRSATWKAKERIDLSLGNASAVELIVNGQRFTNLGNKRGQPLNNIVITEKDGLKIPR